MNETYVVNVKVGGKYVGIPVMRGEPGRTMQIRRSDDLLQWKYEDESDSEWRTLFDFSTITTIKGDKGDPGTPPHIGENGNWFVGEKDTGIKAQGDKGEPGKTPERGVDFWTASDQESIVDELKTYVDEEILNGEW